MQPGGFLSLHRCTLVARRCKSMGVDAIPQRCNELEEESLLTLVEVVPGWQKLLPGGCVVAAWRLGPWRQRKLPFSNELFPRYRLATWQHGWRVAAGPWWRRPRGNPGQAITRKADPSGIIVILSEGSQREAVTIGIEPAPPD